MLRVDVASAVTRRPLLRWAAWCALLAIAALLVWWHFDHPSAELIAAPAEHDARIVSQPLVGPFSGILISATIAALAAWFLLRLQGRAGSAREARRHLQALSDVLDVWQWRTDASHRIVFMRPPTGALAGDWAPTAPTRSLWDHFAAADEAALRAQMSSGASLADIEVSRKTADGRTAAGRLRGRAIGAADGTFAGYVGTLREVAGTGAAPGSRGPAEAPTSYEDAGSHTAAMTSSGASNLARAVAEAEAERESFSYTVSHDLRAPIRVVEGFTKIVKEDYADVLDRMGHDHLDRVLGAAARMNSMIESLLALSKLSTQPLLRQPVNLSQLATFIAEDLRRQWPDREVEFEVMGGMQVQGDPTLLRVVLENLLGNAWKYTGQCRAAHIRFERSDDEPPTFTVSDNGAGFDMRFADRLFGVFQRLHSASEFPGTGVGLASVRRIVRRHGGEIWGEAELDRGARFRFTLPQDGVGR